jgi:hypothetical protein
MLLTPRFAVASNHLRSAGRRLDSTKELSGRRCRAEGWVQHARSFRSKIVGPHERQHVAGVFHHRVVDRL